MNREIVLDGVVVNDDTDCYFVAEIGHNHKGSLEIAKDLFRQAKLCGANAVKLQKRDNRSLFTREMYDSPYVNDNSYGDTYGLHREALEFGHEEYVELKHFAQELGLTFFATPFDFPSVDFLEKVGVPMYKTASGDLKTTPLLKYIAETGKPMLVSTGGASMEDVCRAHDAIATVNSKCAILQCTASYPVDPEQMNLRVISTYREKFPEAVVGLSDHQSGIAMALVAYMLGARVIEKHFTLHRSWKGTDHAFSLEPIGLQKLIRDIKRARVALGNGVKTPLPEETQPIYKMGKKLVAARNLPAGTVLSKNDVAIKSPNDGLPPYELDNVIGRRLTRVLAQDENISLDFLAE